MIARSLVAGEREGAPHREVARYETAVAQEPAREGKESLAEKSKALIRLQLELSDRRRKGNGTHGRQHTGD